MIGALIWNKTAAKITKLLLRNAISDSPCWPCILRVPNYQNINPWIICQLWFEILLVSSMNSMKNISPVFQTYVCVIKLSCWYFLQIMFTQTFFLLSKYNTIDVFDKGPSKIGYCICKVGLLNSSLASWL